MKRYERQLPLIGLEGQELLRCSKVGIAGCGGLGTNVVTSLASAGVGHLSLIDFDSPCESNLNRQYAFRSYDVCNKSAILARWAKELSPNIEVESHEMRMDDGNVRSIFKDCDIIIDCLDNIEGRHILSDHAYESDKLLIHGGVSGFHGQVATVGRGSACLRCLLRVKGLEVPSSICPMVSTIGAMQANEAIMILTGLKDGAPGRMVTLNMVNDQFDCIMTRGNPKCPICGRYG